MRTGTGGTSLPPTLVCVALDAGGQLQLIEASRRERGQVPGRPLIVGDGGLRERIVETIAQDAIPEVILTGFRTQSELSKAQATAHVFAFLYGVQETWQVASS